MEHIKYWVKGVSPLCNYLHQRLGTPVRDHSPTVCCRPVVLGEEKFINITALLWTWCLLDTSWHWLRTRDTHANHAVSICCTCNPSRCGTHGKQQFVRRGLCWRGRQCWCVPSSSSTSFPLLSPCDDGWSQKRFWLQYIHVLSWIAPSSVRGSTKWILRKDVN